MRKRIAPILLKLLIIPLFTTICFADNPIIQTNFTADPAPMVYNGRVYLYTGHDSTGATNYLMGDWRCFSSADMVNWTDHGSPLSQKSFSWASTTFPRAWASQCVPRNGKFYWYICTWCSNCATNNNNMQIGVAVSNSPTGPFKDTLGHALVTSGTTLDIDPSVWIDSSGQAYLYWGHTNPFYVLLNQDMISYSGTVHTVSTTTGFGPASGSTYTEGPWFMRRNGLYYLGYAASCCPEQLGYSTSTTPTGPWTYKGVMMPAQGASFTNQSGIIDFMGSSYFFYHNGALPGGNGYQRSVCVEKFTYNTDGTIPTINMTTSGPPQIGNLNPYDTTQAETICWESGVKTEPCSEGGIDVDSIHNGDYIKVKGVDFGTGGAKSFDARVASATNGGNIELQIDSLKGSIIGTCAVSGTGGWQTWATKSCNVTGATGIHDLYFKFTGGSGLLYNFNWWKFTPVQSGIGKTGLKGFEGGSDVKITVDGGKSQTLELDFSPQASQERVNVRLFDISGRPVSTLFKGQLTSQNLTLPINRTEIQAGVYMLVVSLNGKTSLTKTISLH